MDRRLEDRIVEVLVEEWMANAPGTIESKTVYDRLVTEGEVVPAGLMNDLLTRLKDQGYIRGPGAHGRSEISKHGNFTITWVDPDLR